MLAAAIMASFMGAVDTFRAMIPRPDKIANYPKLPRNNFIDDLLIAKWNDLGLAPSPLCDDATFLRRLYLDAIGTLPAPAEA
mgnify:CR=1 FL=1